jgi:hypothetical protein
LENVFDFRIEIFGRTQHVVERFFLPNRAVISEAFIDGAGRRTLDGFHDLNQRNDQASFFVGEWRENQMYVIWHDYGYVERVFDSVIVQAGRQSNVAGRFWKSLPQSRDEGYEVRFIVALEMRECAAVEGHGVNYCDRESSRGEQKCVEKTALVPKPEHVAADAFVRVRQGLGNPPGRMRPGPRDLF